MSDLEPEKVAVFDLHVTVFGMDGTLKCRQSRIVLIDYDEARNPQ
jgi:hypothetical protein